MLTNSVIVEKIADVDHKQYSANEVQFLNDHSSFKHECFLVTSNGMAEVDSLKPIPYAQKVGEKFEIVYSEYSEGFRASFEIEDIGDYIICRGPYHFTSLYEREVFEPFPKLDAGKPKVVIGTSRKGVMIPKSGIAVGNFGLMRSPKRNITTLSIMLIRYEEISEPNQKLDPTVKTPVESGNEQGTAGQL